MSVASGTRFGRIAPPMLALTAILVAAPSLHAQGPQGSTRTASVAAASVRVVGTVRDQQNAIALPGVPVEVVGTSNIVYTDVDGRYTLDLAPGAHELRVVMDGYTERKVTVDVAAGSQPTVDVTLSMTGFSEQVTVTGQSTDAVSSSAEAQMIVRKNAQTITDNMGSDDMRANGDSDAASAMQRITGLSVVDNQYVFVRGLGERYSNTTLNGAVIPTTEPDKKVVPLDLFPTGLIDSVQIAKSYLPDKSAEFAGGLVQVMPLKFPSRPVLDFSYGLQWSENATGKSIPLSPLGNRDWLGFDNGARALPGTFPDGKIVRQGVYTPDVGYSRDQITDFGKALENRWSPAGVDGAPGQNWGAVFGQRFGNLGVVASASQQYRENFVSERRRFYRVADEGLEAVSDYQIDYGTQRAQLGLVGNLAYQFNASNRISVENFYTHSGRDEGRVFEGPNTENTFIYRNYRLQFIEENLLSNGVSGDHYFQNLSNSRLEWRGTYSRATRDEPDLRETLYQQNINGTGPFLLADESQSGFRMFNDLEDKSTDVAASWTTLLSAGGKPTQLKVGLSFIDRTRDFTSRRFRYIPITAGSGNLLPINLEQTPEALFASENVGTFFRFNEETRPVDAYDGAQTTASVYGMGDFTLSARLRLIAGARIERFDQEVNTFDPFGLFVSRITAENENTDVFPGVNLVYALKPDMNLRVSYSTTVNRPEFRELAAFEFTDVVGNRAIRGNPDLNRALIQNVDARWERFNGGRGVLAASVFFKAFNDPIERVVVAGAQPIVTFQNADRARNLGFELEVGRQITEQIFLSANYTFVDSTITLNPDQRTVQTSLERPLAGQSKNLVNLTGEYTWRGFTSRVLYNFFGDRISDVGSNAAPDVIEQGRGLLDLVFSQRVGRVNFRLNLENLTDAQYLFTQGTEDQRVFKLGRMVTFSAGISVF
jgi:outer membrane receptor protein involved in Fe transport